MESKKKDLAKLALAALVLSAGTPAANASLDSEMTGTHLAGGGCGAASNSHPASGSCGASQSRYSPATSGCGAATHRYNAPASHGCGAASDSETPPPPPNGNHNTKYDQYGKPIAAGRYGQNHGGNPTTQGGMDHMDSSGSSSYQGTTTGPGPNDGYPSTPAGSYQANERPMRR